MFIGDVRPHSWALWCQGLAKSNSVWSGISYNWYIYDGAAWQLFLGVVGVDILGLRSKHWLWSLYWGCGTGQNWDQVG